MTLARKTNEIAKPRALQLLEKALGELRSQLFNSDFGRIAKRVRVSERTVYRYVREGIVADYETGKGILDCGRGIVGEREGEFGVDVVV